MKYINKSKKLKKIYSYLGGRMGYVYLMLMFFTSGITTVLTKYLMVGGLNAFHILTYTSFVGVLVLLILNSKKDAKGLIESKIGIRKLGLAALTGFSLYEITFNIALQYMTVSETIIIYYSHPIFLYFAGLFFLNKGKKKVVNKKILIGILMSFAGIYFVLTGGKLLTWNVNQGLFYIFISMISITIFTILGKKTEIPEKQFLFVGQAISLASGIIVLTVKGWWVAPLQKQMIYLLFIAIVYNLINMLFYVKTIQYLSVEKLSTLTYLSPIITSILAVAILKEPVLTSTAVGLAMVIVGNVVASLKEA